MQPQQQPHPKVPCKGIIRLIELKPLPPAHGMHIEAQGHHRSMQAQPEPQQQQQQQQQLSSQGDGMPVVFEEVTYMRFSQALGAVSVCLCVCLCLYAMLEILTTNVFVKMLKWVGKSIASQLCMIGNN